MEIFFKKIKSAFPKAIVQYEKNYVSFTFGGGLYYQLRVQKDKVRMMATNYPNKAKLGDCLKIIRKNNIEGQKINGKEIIFEVGVKNPEIFTLRLEMPYTGTQLENEKFNSAIVDSCAKFHEVLLPLVNAFLKQPVADLYALMGGNPTPVTVKVEQVKDEPKKKSVKPKVSLQKQLADALIEHFPDAIIKKIDTDNYLDIHLPSVHQKKGTHLGINTVKGLIKIVFYCREDSFNELAISNSKKIELYAQGVRIKNNPTFNTVEKAVDASVNFVNELKKATTISSKNTNKSRVDSKKQPLKQRVIKSPKEGNDFEEMIKAYKKGDFKKVAELVEKGNRPLQFNQDDSVIENELIAVCAAEEVDLDLLKQIIKRGDDLDARNVDSDQYTAVHYCAWDGKIDALSLLLENGASPDIAGGDGRTALHLATALGHTDAVELLINAGVDLERRILDGNKYYSKKGATALREALINQRWEVVDLLIEYGADISGLSEPCIESYKGEKDLFEVIKLLGEDGEYSDGNYDEDKLQELENRVKGVVSENEDEEQNEEAQNENSIIILRVGNKVNPSMFKKTANIIFWFGEHKEIIIKDILYSEEYEKHLVLTADNKGNQIDYWDLEMISTQLADNYRFDIPETEIEEDQSEEEEIVEDYEFDEEEEEKEEEQEQETKDLDDFDIIEDSVVNYISDKIKNGKYLTSLLYINKTLSSRGYETDNHQAYFFDSSVVVSDSELDGFLVVNMDGFYSNCMNDEEMRMIFSWSGVNDLEYKENKKGCSIDIIADQGRLTIKKEGSRSLKILHTFYKNIWETINDKFKDEPIIMWNDVRDMGIKEVGFSTFNDYVTFDISQEDEENIELKPKKKAVPKKQNQSIEEDHHDEVNEEDETFIEEDFFVGKAYEKHYIRFQEIADRTGIVINEIKTEPTPKERDELWDIVRAFVDRIYELDNEKSPDINEINTLCFNAIVALHWCDLMINDKRFSMTNGRFRRDTIALALCLYARIDRTYDYYDHVKMQFIMPHMQFSVLLWSVNSIVNLGQDNLFGMFTQKQAEMAQKLFTDLDKKNQASGGFGVVAPDNMPDNHPLKAIWYEVFSLFRNVRIPFQFIKNYISLELPKRSFIQNLLSNEGKNSPGVNVTLLDIDKQKNITFLARQIEHKQFPADWSFINDIAFISIYFATKTDGNIDKEEIEIILTQIGEWIRDEDQHKTKKLSTAAFEKAKEQFDKDNSNDRFSFVLENIRRHIFIQKEYDMDEAKKQLEIILNDLLAIAEADKEVKSEEVDLVVEIRDNWGIVWDTGEVEPESNDDENNEEGISDADLARLLVSYGVESEIELTNLNAEQAKELINYTGPLNLSGLTNISEEVAEILTFHRGNLILDGLNNISEKIIAILARHQGGYLSLDGLNSISDKSLELLAQNNKHLFLNGLTTLTDKGAMVLAANKNSLTLDGITHLSDRAIEALSKHQGGYLSLDGLNSISEKGLASLSKHYGDLFLNGLTSISDQAAEQLSKHKGNLSLNGITSLSNKAATVLSKHEGEITMEGLSST